LPWGTSLVVLAQKRRAATPPARGAYAMSAEDGHFQQQPARPQLMYEQAGSRQP
jgi:hypothetical protein